MLSSFFSREFVRFFRRTMSCFSCCFRVKDDRKRAQINRVRKPITSIHKEPVDPLAKNCLWSVLVSEDESSDLAGREDGRCGVTGSPLVDDELRAEAKFLKACGTIPQTPTEIRNAEMSKDSQPLNEVPESTFHSLLPHTATEEISEKQADQLQSPIRTFWKWENGSDSPSHTSSSSKTEKDINSFFTSSSEGNGVGHAAKDTQLLNLSDSNTPIVQSKQCKNRSVHFESQSDKCSFTSRSSSPKTSNKPLKPSESPYNHSLLKPSPYPTPLKLTDDMQTPGTVFPSSVNRKENGKNQKIRVQYVYSGISEEKSPLFEEPIKEEFSTEEYLDQPENETPQSQVKLQESPTENESNVCPTLSSWLPHKSNDENCIDQSLVPISQGLPDFGQTPGDRPILGIVTANWNAEETSVTPKWWNGNGIPNTTNKYKEDQKVSWHETPFEQRLVKALSEEKFVTKRKQPEETTIIEY
uniref:protein JASON-like n=1 Tax=Erigeron canadensis TaxID=72917 RepID=UPI001CB8F954|nr:protein JASON-like [Erigeron canadensis]